MASDGTSVGRNLKSTLCVHCCVNAPVSLSPSWLPQGGTHAFFYQFPVDSQFGRYSAEATMQNENCHELQHCDSDFNHKLITSFENTVKTEFA